jgi:hypothetical protein
MKLSRSAVFWIVAVAFVGFLLYSTVRTQQVTCEVCIAFGSGSRCATASGPTADAATTTAQTAACGPLASGMDESIACSRARPVSTTCSGT